MVGFNIGGLSFTAYCSGSSKKIAEEKKPFKRKYVNVKLGNGGMSMLEFKQLIKRSIDSRGKSECSCQGEDITAVAGDDRGDEKLPSICTFGPENGMPTSARFKYLVEDYDMIVFEPGSFAIKRISSILKQVGINKNETVWKKEIVPLNDYYANMEKSKVFEEGFKLIFTNTKTGHKLIFNVSFGNSFSELMSLNYDFHAECSNYNKIIDLITNLEPISSNGTYPKKIDVDFIKDWSVVDRVKSIKCDCFSQSKNLTSVNFLGEIESLGEAALFKCKNLQHVNFMKPVKYIENKAFLGCTSLQEIRFPEGLKKLGGFAFSQCSSLKYIFLPDSLEKVIVSAFENTPEDLKIFYKGKEFNKKDFMYYFGTYCGHVSAKGMYK